MTNNPKGIIGAIIVGIIIVVVVVAVVIASSILNISFSESYSTRITFNDKELMEDKIDFDSEKRFLENGLFVTGGYAAYLNGNNGTIYNVGWKRCEGTDIYGNPYSYSCWKFVDVIGVHEVIPEAALVESQLADRINDTYKGYVPLLEHVKIEEIRPPLQLDIYNSRLELSYGITNLTLSNEFLNHTMEERGVGIEATVPIRYIMLYQSGKDFTENSEEKLNKKLIDALDHVTVCTGDGQLTQSKAEEIIEEELVKISADLAVEYPETEWELILIKPLDDFQETSPPVNPNYHIEFTIKVTVNDTDMDRRVPTTEAPQKVGITFAINDEIDFERKVSYICGDSTNPSNCGGSGSAAVCSDSTCTYWTNDGPTESGAIGDCSIGTDCFCQKTESCECTNSPPDKCFNEDESKPSPLKSDFAGCFECGSKNEICCNTPSCTGAGCRGSLVCKSGCKCGTTTTTTIASTTTTVPPKCVKGVCVPINLCKAIGMKCYGGCGPLSCCCAP
ncbi:MAG: hypothetical protein JSV92_01060 [archaeon]|nr:MAG: hypothetical protein JSV92_01060 [archaeon]